MLGLKLAVPVFLDSQLKEIAETTGFPINQIRKLAWHELPPLMVYCQDDDGHHKYDTAEYDMNSNKGITGSDAIIWLCQEKGIKINPLESLNIPLTVYEECDQNQWHDISSSFADVIRKSSFVERLMEYNTPKFIIFSKIYDLWQSVEFLETGLINGHTRRWNHGLRVRGLNDIGFSLINGWSEYMEENFEVRDEYESSEEQEARKRRRLMKEIQWYTNFYENKGLSYIDAIEKASNRVKGHPHKRTLTIEGIGILLPARMNHSIVFAFLKNHKNVFGQSEIEKEILKNLEFAEETNDAFVGKKYELEGNGAGTEHWSVAVANVMIRETGINFDIYIADNDDKFENRSFILFQESLPWFYNEKEKKLSRNMLFQILDRYALELHLSVCTNCYYIMEVEDLD